MRRVQWIAPIAMLAACCFALACSADNSGGGQRGGDTLDNSRLGNAKAPAAGVTNTNAQGSGGNGGTAGSSAGSAGGGVTVGDLEGCTGSSATAPPSGQPKVDIIWVVDASGSMLDEQMKIGANLTKFADDITSANLDVHIVMMTTSAAIPVICPVTPADPLAGSKLAGDPRYLFLDTGVDSHNLLDVAVSSFSQYQSFLRPDAVTHFVMVTDDESTYQGLGSADERASTFKTDMTALLGKDFTQHTIASEGPTACGDPNCMPDVNSGICFFVMLGCGAAAPGDTYYTLAMLTDGLTASICQSDWQTIFDPLSAAVIASAPLPCNYPIPPPPHGEDLDPSKVNVGWIEPGATDKDQQVFPKAADIAACGDKLGWYYDSPSAPKEVLLCPATCTRVAQGGTLNVAFGCSTVTID